MNVNISYKESFEKLWNISNAKNLSEVPILLKGLPGTGKTAMAEWLADYLKMPLVTIVVGDSDPCNIWHNLSWYEQS